MDERQTASKKKSLNRSQRPKPHFVSFQQRTVADYIEKEKTEPFPKTQVHFVSFLVHDYSLFTLTHTFRYTHIHTLKHLLIPHPNRELCNVISKKTTQVVVVADKNQIHNSGFWPSPGMILKRTRIILVKDHKVRSSLLP